mmetsp:Transcript_5223/g.9943  ORF Transcript_5223/g.9943 Transcript_5223/m.9943 type:complete len:211 (-) Transcript_5223:1577-2209(-)
MAEDSCDVASWSSFRSGSRETRFTIAEATDGKSLFRRPPARNADSVARRFKISLVEYFGVKTFKVKFEVVSRPSAFTIIASMMTSEVPPGSLAGRLTANTVEGVGLRRIVPSRTKPYIKSDPPAQSMHSRRKTVSRASPPAGDPEQMPFLGDTGTLKLRRARTEGPVDSFTCAWKMYSVFSGRPSTLSRSVGDELVPSWETSNGHWVPST